MKLALSLRSWLGWTKNGEVETVKNNKCHMEGVSEGKRGEEEERRREVRRGCEASVLYFL